MAPCKLCIEQVAPVTDLLAQSREIAAKILNSQIFTRSNAHNHMTTLI